MNRLFFDHGEEAILEVVCLALNNDDLAIINALEFVSKSLLQYRKHSWRNLLTNNLKDILSGLSEANNYFARVKSVEILYQLAVNDTEALEEYYQWLQDQFYLHYDRENDPLILFTIFNRLNTKYGGTWVYDYEIDMITKMLEHSSPAMQIVGLACFKTMNPDRNEVPESLWYQIDLMKATFSFDFFDFRMAFEQKLSLEKRFSYTIKELETLIADQ
ncbi:MAG: hypothetical protein ACFHWX_09360 [Bacteroidota bacterium]